VNRLVTNTQSKPALDEEMFQQLLAAAYVLQEQTNRIARTAAPPKPTSPIETERCAHLLRRELWDRERNSSDRRNSCPPGSGPQHPNSYDRSMLRWTEVHNMNRKTQALQQELATWICSKCNRHYSRMAAESVDWTCEDCEVPLFDASGQQFAGRKAAA